MGYRHLEPEMHVRFKHLTAFSRETAARPVGLGDFNSGDLRLRLQSPCQSRTSYTNARLSVGSPFRGCFWAFSCFGYKFSCGRFGSCCFSELANHTGESDNPLLATREAQTYATGARRSICFVGVSHTHKTSEERTVRQVAPPPATQDAKQTRQHDHPRHDSSTRCLKRRVPLRKTKPDNKLVDHPGKSDTPSLAKRGVSQILSVAPDLFVICILRLILQRRNGRNENGAHFAKPKDN